MKIDLERLCTDITLALLLLLQVVFFANLFIR